MPPRTVPIGPANDPSASREERAEQRQEEQGQEQEEREGQGPEAGPLEEQEGQGAGQIPEEASGLERVAPTLLRQGPDRNFKQ
jgi:hypothetical protein